MPYIFRRSPSGGIDIYLRDTGKKVAHSDTLQGAQGYAWHATHAEKKRPKRRKKNG